MIIMNYQTFVILCVSFFYIKLLLSVSFTIPKRVFQRLLEATSQMCYGYGMYQNRVLIRVCFSMCLKVSFSDSGNNINSNNICSEEMIQADHEL